MLSSAPTADFRRRRAQRRSRMARLGPPLQRRVASLTAVSTTADWIITGRKSARFVACGLLWFSLAWIDVAARSTVLYAVQGRWPHHGPQGFDAAMSRTHSSRDGAGRIARSSRPIPAGTAIRREMRRRDISIASGGWRCSFSVPLEPRAALVLRSSMVAFCLRRRHWRTASPRSASCARPQPDPATEM
jgi:hypothetical protein